MRHTKEELWQRFQKYYAEFPSLNLAIDISRMNFGDDYFATMEPGIQRAFRAMTELEGGAIANPDEKRMVGHYWLRAPERAPKPEIRNAIEQALVDVKKFAAEVHAGTVRGADGPFRNLLLIGIGGSALGPQFIASALGHPKSDKLRPFFFDNTDPDGMDRVLAALEGELGRTLCMVISKSGGTKETRNGMIEAQAAYDRAGLKFAEHTVAITQADSGLDKLARKAGWLRRFPMWEWVGGRTSAFSAVGLLPAALLGFDIDSMLGGAKACDAITRVNETRKNPAALLALMWLYIGNGRGEKDMVVIPYKDRLELFSRYLQQLVMESLGKERDVNGQVVNQGIAVYGNKGSTDQHAYVQQLREGVHNFFVTFIEVLHDRTGDSIMVEPGVTSGDYLSGFYLGTRQALYDNDRESMTLSIKGVCEYNAGVLIALFERAVGLYANLINVNAYHQPGVQAGKLAADAVIALQAKVIDFLSRNSNAAMTSAQIASGIGAHGEYETVFKICQHLGANPTRGVRQVSARNPFDSTFQAAPAKEDVRLPG